MWTPQQTRFNSILKDHTHNQVKFDYEMI
jgi:hypothetical protein